MDIWIVRRGGRPEGNVDINHTQYHNYPVEAKGVHRQQQLNPADKSVLRDCCVEPIGRRGEILDPWRPGEVPARGDELATRARRRPG